MLDDLMKVIKQAAAETVEAGEPAGIVYGEVTSQEPLMVTVNPRLVLTKEFLLLTSQVRQHTVQMSGTDRIGKPEEYTVYNSLQMGDEVIMIKQQGGQKYIILDKISKA